MLYRPNFCCQCGEKIDRIEWKLFTSRRFCEYCEAEFSFQDKSPKVSAIIAIVIGLFGFGGYFQNDGKTLNISKASKASEQRPLAGIENYKNQLSESREDSKMPEPYRDRANISNKALPANVTQQRGIANPEVFAEGSPKEAQTQLFACGARTKKGTPCSRKVKGNERCWQHKGQPAMVTEDN